MKKHKGVRGRRIKIEPEQLDTLLDAGTLAERGKVIMAGPEAYCKVGDRVVFVSGLLDKIEIDDKVYYYAIDNDDTILEIL